MRGAGLRVQHLTALRYTAQKIIVMLTEGKHLTAAASKTTLDSWKFHRDASRAFSMTASGVVFGIANIVWPALRIFIARIVHDML
jgi:hypothetical protein